MKVTTPMADVSGLGFDTDPIGMSICCYSAPKNEYTGSVRTVDRYHRRSQGARTQPVSGKGGKGEEWVQRWRVHLGRRERDETCVEDLIGCIPDAILAINVKRSPIRGVELPLFVVV